MIYKLNLKLNKLLLKYQEGLTLFYPHFKTRYCLAFRS